MALGFRGFVQVWGLENFSDLGGLLGVGVG